MDTVHEENNFAVSATPSQPKDHKEHHVTSLTKINETSDEEPQESASSSRRPSAIIAALRRPSQAIALSAAQAVMNQRRYLLGLLHDNSERSITEKDPTEQKEAWFRQQNRQLSDDVLTTILSALYAKLLVVLGMAFPITEIISHDIEKFFYQGFYLYLYLGSIVFVSYMYLCYVRERTVNNLISSYQKTERYPSLFQHWLTINSTNKSGKYGSFYLRLGAVAFGIGSMVYSGLEFGQYFELKNNQICSSNALQAITPATRMLLTLVQVQFIFLNTKNLDLNRHQAVARFGLMHMVATNLCEWLYVLVEETKHEIIHLSDHYDNSTNVTANAVFCQEGQVMSRLVRNVSPFLFPCTIEYSLICAVILYEMWKKVRSVEKKMEMEKAPQKDSSSAINHYIFNSFGDNLVNSNHHFSVDCSNAHRGLFAGIMVIVATIISLIMFFVLANEPNDKNENDKEILMAEFEVNIVELALYILTTIAVSVAMMQMRSLKYDRKMGADGKAGIGLDNTLLVVAQTGMFIYCVFSIIGYHFSVSTNTTTGLLAEVFSFIQTCLQTMFVLDSWWRRCRNLDQMKNKPGKELITFLIISNMAMWTINTLEKNRAEFRPAHLDFFGPWAWTIITHISMPLAIFYRFHSTICLFEIWKSAYKVKSEYKNSCFPLVSHHSG